MKITNVVKTKNGYVMIDTCQLTNTFGNMFDMMGFGNPNAVAFQYETMVFKCDKNGNVEDWGDLDVKNYKTEKEAVLGHKKMIKKWEIKTNK